MAYGLFGTPTRRAITIAATVAAALISSVGAPLAQAPPSVIPGPAEPRLPTLPAPVPAPQADIELTLPSPRRTPERRAVDELRFPVRDITVEGATVYGPDELAPLLAPVIGNTVGLSDIIAVAESIEAKYRADGYILTRAFVPPQRAGDGVFRIQVVEGYVKSIVVEGVDGGIKSQIERRLEPLTAVRPTRLPDLERALLLAGDLPGILTTGVLRPSEEPGAADLVVTVSRTPVDGLASITNRGSPYAGPWSAYGEASYNSALDSGDRITLGASLTRHTEEQRFGLLRYAQPLGGSGLVAGFDAQYSDGKPGHTLRELDAHTTAYKLGPRLSYPLIRSRRENLILDGGFSWQESRISIFHNRFARDAYSTMDARATYSEFGRFLGGGTSILFGVVHGLGIGGSGMDDEFVSRVNANPEFTKLTSEVRRSQPIAGPVSASATVLGQYALSRLFAAEEFFAGGSRIGRGYDPAEITGKHGVGGAFELRYGEPLPGSYQLYGFYDRARVWHDSASPPGKAHLSSAGLGIRYPVVDKINATLELARPISQGIASADNQRPWRLYLDLVAGF